MKNPSSHIPHAFPLVLILLTSSLCMAADVTWDGSSSTSWATGSNWDNNTGPAEGDVAYINSGTVVFSTGTTPNLNAIRMTGGTLTFSGGTFSATANSSRDSHVSGSVIHTGTEAMINELEIGRSSVSNGTYELSGGRLEINRGLDGNSLYLGGNRNGNNAGTGSLEITGGSFVTRTGVKLGHATSTGIGNFTVLGSDASEIGIGTSGNDIDGTWEQHSGSTLRVGIDSGGVTKIFIDEDDEAGGTAATFESGSILDVDYYNDGSGGGTWTVMELENAEIDDNGLAFAPGVDTEIWSFSVDNSGPNGFLKVTAAGEPSNLIRLDVGSTMKQKMRYGMDYERLWYWTNSMSPAEKDMVARWSVVDCDIDYIRVAMNSGYELTEGDFDMSAYTSKIIPMMRDMQDANPDIKFFASPRPLDEAQSNVAWQPYPQWITGSTGSSSNFSFDWQKCAEYLVRYVELMKSEGFKISFMDMTNEWNFITATHVRDIRGYMESQLDAEDMPLIVAPSAWSYSQGRGWISGANTASKKAAIDIAACHNTDKTGTAESFAERVAEVLGPETEVWNSELHGWKSTSGADEVLTSSFMFEAIRAGFSGINGWLAIGTTNQGHCYILNPGGNNPPPPARNVKYFIFRKLSTTSNYGYALDIEQPEEFKSTAALIRGDLLTVWMINDSGNLLPIEFNSSDRTISNEGITVTRWSESIAVEGISSQIPAHSPSLVRGMIEANSLYCFEVPLNPSGPPYTVIQAENFDAMSGIQTEDTTDEGGGLNVGYISHGDYLRFDDLAPGAAATVRFRVAARSGQPSGKIEIRLDSPTGTMVGSVDVPDTNGWQNWVTIETQLAPVTGSHSIYLSFVENAATPTNGSMFNLNWLAISLPVSPTGVSAAVVSASAVELSWDPVTNAIGYNVKRSTTPGGPYSTIASAVSGTDFSDTDVMPGTTYYYVITTVYESEESQNSTSASAVTPDPIDLDDVVISSAVTRPFGAGHSVVLSIENSNVGLMYQIETSPDLAAAWQSVGSAIPGNGGLLQLVTPMPPSDTERFYRVLVWLQ